MTDRASVHDAADSNVPRVALTRAECARALGVSPRTIDQLIAGRRGNGFPVVYVGAKPLIPVEQLRQWLADQAKKKGGQP